LVGVEMQELGIAWITAHSFVKISAIPRVSNLR
jgi:hypothetical protein